MRTGAVSLATRALSIGSTFVLIPLVFNHLGPERYGLWMTLSVIFVYLKLADGGVLVGLMSLVSRADGADDREQIKFLFSSAMAVALLVGIILTVVSIFVVPLLDWQGLLKLSDRQLGAEAAAVAGIIVLSLAVGYPTGVTRQGRLGLQQGAAANAWDLASTLTTFGGQLAVIYFNLGLVALATVTAFTPVLINAVSSATFFLGKGKIWTPRPSYISWSIAKRLFASGSMFTLLALTQALSVQIEPVLIARLIGAEAVAHYSVVQKLFLQPQIIVTMFLVAQFPAYGEALVRGEDAWIIKHFRQTAAFAVIGITLFCGLLALVAQPLLKLWVGAALEPSTRLVICLAIYGVVAAIANIFTYFFFALGLYRRVILAFAAMIAINIPLAIILIPRLGAEGAAIATIIGYVVTLIAPSILSARSILRDLPRLRERTRS